MCGAGKGLALLLLAGVGAMAATTEAAKADSKTAAKTSAAMAANAKAADAKTAEAKATVEKAVHILSGDLSSSIAGDKATAMTQAKRQKHARDVEAAREAEQKMDQDYMRAAGEREKARRQAKKAGMSRVELPAKAGNEAAP
jgi:hypothetical protein